MQIKINVANKIATVLDAPFIICGNSDYIAVFNFDSEWETYETKTARFTFIRDYKERYIDVIFNGNSCSIPVLSNITEVKIGVYAGDLQTTTPAKVECKKSILCGNPIHTEPPKDVYNEILKMYQTATNEAKQAKQSAANAEQLCGDIETALDNIIDIQTTLIGGVDV